AKQEWQAGLTAYNQKNFSVAAAHFEKCIGAGTADATTAYYLALSSMQSGNMPRARQMLQYIVTNFPASQQAQISRPLLEKMGISLPKPAGAPAAAAAGGVTPGPQNPGSKADRKVLSDADYRAEYGRIPAETRIPVRAGSGQSLVEAQLDGRN